MEDRWHDEIIAFIVEKALLERSTVERILEIHTPHALPPFLHEVLRDILTGRRVTKEGVSPMTHFAALNSLLDLQAEKAENEMLEIEAILDEGRIPDPSLDEIPEAFIEYSAIVDDICSKTGETIETIHQVHRAYLEYVYLKAKNPETLIPFLRWYLMTEENRTHKH